jgi:hypothetical protein
MHHACDVHAGFALPDAVAMETGRLVYVGHSTQGVGQSSVVALLASQRIALNQLVCKVLAQALADAESKTRLSEIV